MSKIGIGSTVWYFDKDRRQYTKAVPPRQWGDLIFRAHFVERKIVGETSRSWLAGFEHHPDKIPKNATGAGVFGSYYFTKEAVDDAVYMNDNAHKISEEVRRTDAATLRKVAELIGYKESARG